MLELSKKFSSLHGIWTHTIDTLQHQCSDVYNNINIYICWNNATSTLSINQSRISERCPSFQNLDPLVLTSTCCCSKCLRRNVDKITFPTSAFIALQERNKRSSILFIWSYFRWKVVVSVVDIDGIVANYCFNFLFTICPHFYVDIWNNST
jgi:hypothetical protein